MSLLKHIRAIVLLPVAVTIIVPCVILYRVGLIGNGNLPELDRFPFPALALVYLSVGLWLVVSTVLQFRRDGGGTLAPWDPPRKLVVEGIYRRVRNPMISGVLFILLAEATFIGAKPLMIWFLLFLAANMIYIPMFEERSLEKRFGDDYLVYKQNVPRWIPRAREWVQHDDGPSA